MNNKDINFSDKATFYNKLYKAKENKDRVGVYKFEIGRRISMFSIISNNIISSGYNEITIPELNIKNFVPVNYLETQNGYLLTDTKGQQILVNLS